MQVDLDHALGVGSARLGGELDAVDDIAAVARQLDAVLHLGIARARLGELARHAADLDDWAVGAIGQHHGHLQQHAEGVADVVGVEFGEAFGAVAALEQEGAALGDLAELRLQPARLAGEDQRRITPEARLGGLERSLVGPRGLLLDR